MKQESDSEESPQDEIFLWFWEKQERGELLDPALLLVELQSNFGLEETIAKRFLDEFLDLADFSGQHESQESGSGEILTLGSFLHYELNPDVPHRRGGLASVHKAHDHRFDRPVAIKVPLKRFVHEKEVRSRIMREARLSARLQHPNIVPIYEFGESGPSGHPFFVMKYVEGKTLLEAINSSSRDIASLLRLLRVVRETVGALEHAHSRGIIHRDIKPENIMIGQFNESHLLDFGCADEVSLIREQKSFRARAIEKFSQTVENGVFGTYAYMAPEQAKGHLHSQCDKTDVFGIGGLLCHILTGWPVYCGTSAEVIDAAKHGRTENALIRLQDKSIPQPLYKLTKACLQTEPDQRPDAAEVGRLLDSFFDSIAQESVRNERRARWATFGLMTVLLLISMFVGLRVLYEQYITESLSEESQWNLNETWVQQRLIETEIDRQELAQQWRQIATEPIPLELDEKLQRLQSAVERLESVLQPSEAYPETIFKINQLKSNLQVDRETLESEQARFEQSRLDREKASALLGKLSENYLHDERIALAALLRGRVNSSLLMPPDFEQSFQALGMDIRKPPNERGKGWITEQSESYRRDICLFLFMRACVATEEGDLAYCNTLLDWCHEFDPREELKHFRAMVPLTKAERQKAFDQLKLDFPLAESPTVEVLSIVLDLVDSAKKRRTDRLNLPFAFYRQSELLIATYCFTQRMLEQESSADPWELIAFLRGRGFDVDLWEISLEVSLGNWERVIDTFGKTTKSVPKNTLLNPLLAYAAAKSGDDGGYQKWIASSRSNNAPTLVAEVLALIELERFEQAKVRLEATKKHRLSTDAYSLLALKLRLAETSDIQRSQWESDYPQLANSPSAKAFWIEYLLEHQRFQEVADLVHSELDSGIISARTLVAGVEAAVKNDQWLEARDLFIASQSEKQRNATLRVLSDQILSVDGVFDVSQFFSTMSALPAEKSPLVLKEFISQGNETEAVAMIKRFTERDLRDQEIAREVARGYLVFDKLGLSDEPMLEHIARYPNDLEARLLLNRYYVDREMPEEGRLQLEAAFNSGENAPLHLQLALFQRFTESGEIALADQLLKRLLFSEKSAIKLVQILKREVHSNRALEN